MTVNVPEDLTTEKLEFPIFETVIPDGEPIADFRPFLIFSLFVSDEVNE